MIGHYRQKLIEGLIAKEGGRGVYCKVDVRLNWMEYQRNDHDATIDHITPRSKGGRDDLSNYALSCRRCNQAKADKSVEAFLVSPHFRRGQKLSGLELARVLRKRYGPWPLA